jgi:hypothetical protein
MIFRSYLKLGSLNLLMADLRKQGIVTKVRTLKTGATVGGIPFTQLVLSKPRVTLAVVSYLVDLKNRRVQAM